MKCKYCEKFINKKDRCLADKRIVCCYKCCERPEHKIL